MIMQTVNIADLQSNLSAYLERVQNGEELIVEDHNRLIARLLPLAPDESLDDEERLLVEEGIMRLPRMRKSEAFFDLPAPTVATDDILTTLRAERDDE